MRHSVNASVLGSLLAGLAAHATNDAALASATPKSVPAAASQAASAKAGQATDLQPRADAAPADHYSVLMSGQTVYLNPTVVYGYGYRGHRYWR